MRKLLVAVALVGLMVSGAQAGIIIDHFSDGAFTITLTTGTTSGSQGPGLSQVIGGTRDETLTITTASLFEASEVKVVFGGGLHFLSYANDPGVASTLDLTYDAAGAGLNADFSKQSAIAFLVTNLDQNLDAKVTLTDGASASSSVSTTIPGPLVSGTFSFPMSSFAGLDLTDIDKIVVSFTGPKALDFQLDAIETTNIPEPATLLLLGLGAVPLVRKIRRYV